MTEADFLNAIIDDAVDEISTNYLRPDQREKREGALAAYEDAKLKSIEEIAKLRDPAQRKADEIRDRSEIQNYWYWRMYVLQIEWIMNVYGAYLMSRGERSPFAVTQRGYLKACEVLGVPV